MARRMAEAEAVISLRTSSEKLEKDILNAFEKVEKRGNLEYAIKLNKNNFIEAYKTIDDLQEKSNNSIVVNIDKEASIKSVEGANVLIKKEYEMLMNSIKAIMNGSIKDDKLLVYMEDVKAKMNEINALANKVSEARTNIASYDEKKLVSDSEKMTTGKTSQENVQKIHDDLVRYFKSHPIGMSLEFDENTGAIKNLDKIKQAVSSLPPLLGDDEQSVSLLRILTKYETLIKNNKNTLMSNMLSINGLEDKNRLSLTDIYTSYINEYKKNYKDFMVNYNPNHNANISPSSPPNNPDNPNDSNQNNKNVTLFFDTNQDNLIGLKQKIEDTLKPIYLTFKPIEETLVELKRKVEEGLNEIQINPKLPNDYKLKINGIDFGSNKPKKDNINEIDKYFDKIIKLNEVFQNGKNDIDNVSHYYDFFKRAGLSLKVSTKDNELTNRIKDETIKEAIDNYNKDSSESYKDELVRLVAARDDRDELKKIFGTKNKGLYDEVISRISLGEESKRAQSQITLLMSLISDEVQHLFGKGLSNKASNEIENLLITQGKDPAYNLLKQLTNIDFRQNVNAEELDRNTGANITEIGVNLKLIEGQDTALKSQIENTLNPIYLTFEPKEGVLAELKTKIENGINPISVMLDSSSETREVNAPKHTADIYGILDTSLILEQIKDIRENNLITIDVTGDFSKFDEGLKNSKDTFIESLQSSFNSVDFNSLTEKFGNNVKETLKLAFKDKLSGIITKDKILEILEDKKKNPEKDVNPAPKKQPELTGVETLNLREQALDVFKKVDGLKLDLGSLKVNKGIITIEEQIDQIGNKAVIATHKIQDLNSILTQTGNLDTDKFKNTIVDIDTKGLLKADNLKDYLEMTNVEDVSTKGLLKYLPSAFNQTVDDVTYKLDEKSLHIDSSGFVNFSAYVIKANGDVDKLKFSVKDLNAILDETGKIKLDLTEPTTVKDIGAAHNALDKYLNALKARREIEAINPYLTDSFVVTENSPQYFKDLYSSEDEKDKNKLKILGKDWEDRLNNAHNEEKQALEELNNLMKTLNLSERERLEINEKITKAKANQVNSYTVRDDDYNSIVKDFEDIKNNIFNSLNQNIGTEADLGKNTFAEDITSNFNLLDSKMNLFKGGLYTSKEEATALIKEIIELSDKIKLLYSLAAKKSGKYKLSGKYFELDKDESLTADKMTDEAFSYLKNAGFDISRAKPHANAENKTVTISNLLQNGNIKKVTFQLQELEGQAGKTVYAFREFEEVTGKQLTGVQKWLRGVSGKIESLFQYFSGMYFLRRVFNEVRQGIQFIQSLDKSMTTIYQTMDITTDGIEKLTQGAIDAGKALGSTTDDVVKAIEIYAAYGKTVDEILNQARPTVMLANAAGIDATTASDQIQAVVQQYKELEGQEQRVVNSYEKIAANVQIDFDKFLSHKLEIIY